MPGVNFDNTLGAAYIGSVLAACLYGITCQQMLVYHQRRYKDTLLFKALIYLLWCIDTLHIIFVIHALYYYLITNFSNPLGLLFLNWSIIVQVPVSVASDLIVRSIFLRRMWLVSGRNWLLAACTVVPTLLCFATGMVFTANAFKLGTFSALNSESYVLYLSFGGGVAADIAITVALCVSLAKSRTGFRKTDSLVMTLILYAINGAVLVTVSAVACFVTYTIWPHLFIYIAIYFCLCKMYLNCLLATLNGRKSLHEKMSGISDTPGLSLNSTGRAYRPQMSKELFSMGSINSPVNVNIDREIEKGEDM